MLSYSIHCTKYDNALQYNIGKNMKYILFQQKVSKTIVKIAKSKAMSSLGRSFPCGMHEVEIPSELREYAKKDEENK